MFLGTYFHTLDSKNRLILPTKLVAKLTENIVISKGFDGCLELRTMSDFEQYSSQLMKYSMNKAESRTLVRQLLANAIDLTIDKQNRILIPANLLQEGKITSREITIIGVGNKLEIWSAQEYKNYKQATDDTYEKIAERIDDKINND